MTWRSLKCVVKTRRTYGARVLGLQPWCWATMEEQGKEGRILRGAAGRASTTTASVRARLGCVASGGPQLLTCARASGSTVRNTRRLLRRPHAAARRAKLRVRVPALLSALVRCLTEGDVSVAEWEASVMAIRERFLPVPSPLNRHPRRHARGQMSV